MPAACCLLGRVRGFAYVASSVFENLLRPLRWPDVFIYTPLSLLRDATDADLQALLRVPGIREFSTEEEDVTAALWRDTKPVIRGMSPREVLAATLGVNGEWIGGFRGSASDGLPSRRGSGLAELYNWRRCLQLVERAEAAGASYGWVVASRFDLAWAAPHLPLELLSRDRVWIPEGQDWGGYNSRHAVIPRGQDVPVPAGALSPSEAYLNGWRLLAEGRGTVLVTNIAAGMPDCKLRPEDPEEEETAAPCMNTEFFLWLRLRGLRVRVSRFPGMFWIACGNASGVGTPHGTWRRQAECAWFQRPYRYKEEHAASAATARCLMRPVMAGVAPLQAAALGGPEEQRQGVLAALRLRLQECWCPAEFRGGVDTMAYNMYSAGAFNVEDDPEEFYRDAYALCL